MSLKQSSVHSEEKNQERVKPHHGDVPSEVHTAKLQVKQPTWSANRSEGGKEMLGGHVNKTDIRERDLKKTKLN